MPMLSLSETLRNEIPPAVLIPGNLVILLVGVVILLVGVSGGRCDSVALIHALEHCRGIVDHQ